MCRLRVLTRVTCYASRQSISVSFSISELCFDVALLQKNDDDLLVGVTTDTASHHRLYPSSHPPPSSIDSIISGEIHAIMSQWPETSPMIPQKLPYQL
ncbi:hypothetical protein CDV36_006819 [Fusarium kuroshium]|uniref:Uncharacterized protein n=2 Tax=Fusarium solani species complex TaxID=232080 RepID=A0A3M2S7K5_9HYPO|nr:hypothetical protein CDV36_006819 [Fusarium kuroshium]RSL61827.1 hypothetical protein CEP51_013573 [Fusarium floridanum]